MKYFTIKELCYSDTAKAHKIDNTPNEEIIENLTEFTNEVLDKLRDALCSHIKVSSGFRCEKLNKKIGGSKTSSHLNGYAADLVPVNGDIDGLVECAIELSKTFNFDQIIDEHSKGAHWVHIGYKNLKGQQRKQIKVFKNGKYEKI